MPMVPETSYPRIYAKILTIKFIKRSAYDAGQACSRQR
jgi:hypothetical protein